MASRSVFVAALQTAGIVGDPEATLARFEDNVRALHVRRAAAGRRARAVSS